LRYILETEVSGMYVVMTLIPMQNF
jgi:hypothetical protein